MAPEVGHLPREPMVFLLLEAMEVRPKTTLPEVLEEPPPLQVVRDLTALEVVVVVQLQSEESAATAWNGLQEELGVQEVEAAEQDKD